MCKCIPFSDPINFGVTPGLLTSKEEENVYNTRFWDCVFIFRNISFILAQETKVL